MRYVCVLPMSACGCDRLSRAGRRMPSGRFGRWAAGATSPAARCRERVSLFSGEKEETGFAKDPATKKAGRNPLPSSVYCRVDTASIGEDLGAGKRGVRRVCAARPVPSRGRSTTCSAVGLRGMNLGRSAVVFRDDAETVRDFASDGRIPVPRPVAPRLVSNWLHRRGILTLEPSDLISSRPSQQVFLR